MTIFDSIESNLADQTVNAMFSMMKKVPSDFITLAEATEMLETYLRQPSRDNRGETLIGLPYCIVCKVPFKPFRFDIQKITHLSVCAHRQLDIIDMQSRKN